MPPNRRIHLPVCEWYFKALLHVSVEATLLSQSRSKCPIEIPNGHVSSYCSRLRYSQCVQYSCSENCVSVGSMIYCNGSGFWENAESACFCYGKCDEGNKIILDLLMKR